MMSKADKAEDRRGTRRNTGWLLSMIRGNGYPGGRVAVLATPRVAKKAHRLVHQGTLSKHGPGRVIRACMRENELDYCDDF